MQLSLAYLWQLFLRSFQEPRAAMAQVLSLGISRQTLWQLLLFTCTISVVVSYITGSFLPQPQLPDGTEASQISPFRLGLILLLSQGLLLFLGTVVAGKIARGQGSFDDVLTMIIFQQLIMFVLNLFQLLIALVSPAFAVMFGLSTLVVLIWQLCQFVAEVHGFKSALAVFLWGCVAVILISFALAPLMISLGLVPLEGV